VLLKKRLLLSFMVSIGVCKYTFYCTSIIQSALFFVTGHGLFKLPLESRNLP